MGSYPMPVIDKNGISKTLWFISVIYFSRPTRSGNTTEQLKIRKHQHLTLFSAHLLLYGVLYVGGYYVWPSLAEVNTRARRYVTCWIKHQKKEESKHVHLLKVWVVTVVSSAAPYGNIQRSVVFLVNLQEGYSRL